MISLIRLTFRLLSNPWGLVFLGALIMSSAFACIALSRMEVPERAALSQIAGVLDSATKVTRGRTHRVSYDLEIKRANGSGVVKLTLPESQIGEVQVKKLLGQPVVALFAGTQYMESDEMSKDVWELSSGGTTIIPYEQTRRQRVEFDAFLAAAAPYLGGGGLVVSLAGILWLFRRRRIAVAA
jgi:hypothetical protein